jgi:cysteinyl-tRNA synthetase
MSFKLYNTLTRRKDEFTPLNAPYVGMYVCGPTVYGHSHLGHARSYITPDVLYRYLTYLGYKVKYVQNITDVGHLVGDVDEGDDKIQKQARLENVDPVAIAYKYETSYFEDMDRLNILRPTISCRATGHIIEMITFIEKLIEKGHAYVTDQGNVYFSVESFPAYGKLSGRTTEEAKEGERIAVADDKRAAADFALWKKADKGHIMKWPSPWGMGYPGWHIECSVMSTKYLGDTFDIHCGGMENAFPHHECEIAQAESVTGKEFVRFFVHHNMLTVNGTKMGKSLGNFIILKDLYKKMEPIALRFYILQGHYRSPLDFTDASLAASNTGFDRMRNSVFAMRNALADKNVTPSDDYEDVNKLRADFLAAMDDDMNTPIAISVLYDILKISNTEMAKSDCDWAKVDYVNRTMTTFAEDILGLKFEGAGSGSGDDDMTDKLMKLLIDIRNDARKQKNFAVSDKIRDELGAIGIAIKDGVNGTTYAKK